MTAQMNDTAARLATGFGVSEDAAGFDAYMKEFRLALGVERAAVETNEGGY